MAPKRKVNEEHRVEERTTAADVDGEIYFAQLAQKHWLKSKKSAKVKPDVLKNEIWDILERENFAFRFLLALDNLQILERYVCSADPYSHSQLLIVEVIYGQAILRTRPTSMSY